MMGNQRKPHRIAGLQRAVAALTLIELLVAMAVLALVLVLMVQVVDSIMQSTRVQNQELDTVISARKALDLLESDLRRAVISEDASILLGVGTEPTLAFLTERRGPGGESGHRYLAVAYQSNTDGKIVRSYRSVPFSETDLLNAAALPSTEESQVSDGVLAWQVRLVGDSDTYVSTGNIEPNWATLTYNGLEVPANFRAVVASGPAFSNGLANRTRAVEVWIAAVDESNFRLLEDSGDLESVRAELGADPERWRDELDDSAALPPRFKSVARVLNKTIPLP